MLKRAGQCALDIVEERIGPEPIRLSKPALVKANRVIEVHRRRAEWDQDIAFGARPFILCGLPIRRLPQGVLKYTRRNGKFFLEVVGHPDYGVPFGQDRLVLIWIATQAIRRQSPVVEFESAAEILWEFGMEQNGVHYRRLADAFRRVFGSAIFFGTQEEREGGAVWDYGRAHFFDQMKVWFREDGRDSSRGNRITLSESFWRELRAHPVPVDNEVVRALAANPGCLDLYTWLTWRCHNAKGSERVPLFGPLGLASQLGVQEYARERKFRERVKIWLELVSLYWPKCPARLAKNGAFLELDRAFAVGPSPVHAGRRR